jgi:hypothetical protein
MPDGSVVGSKVPVPGKGRRGTVPSSVGVFLPGESGSILGTFLGGFMPLLLLGWNKCLEMMKECG